MIEVSADLLQSVKVERPTELKECDLIMKGGVTSGVVFPLAICGLAEQYRFFNIGGTSAGAIAAVMTAAAEYRRQCSDGKRSIQGFDRIAATPTQLGKDLLSMFQAAPGTKLMFDICLAFKGSRRMGVLKAVAVSWLWVLIGGLAGIVVFTFGVRSGDCALIALGVVLAFNGVLIAMAGRVWWFLKFVLPAHDYGLCPGIRQKGYKKKPAITDWMHETIQDISGLKADRILTIGDLLRHKITLAAVTTDISSRRPYQLPLTSHAHYFRKSEFDLLFPKDIVCHLIREGGKSSLTAPGGKNDLYKLPDYKDWPVLLVARMSLSFPFLFRAVPLYRDDETLAPAGAPTAAILRRCLFSDGGLTSNFPIHFFDGLLPGKPTFGISLGSLRPNDPNRNQRVVMPDTAHKGENVPTYDIEGLGDFVGAMFDSARNWQDMLQSKLHGYAERIVEIRLDDAKEGGLNLDMSAATVAIMKNYGTVAAKTIIQQFRFDEHRWRRAITALPTMAEALQTLKQKAALTTGESQTTFPELLKNYKKSSLPEPAMTDSEHATLVAFLDTLTSIKEDLAKTRRFTTEAANLRVVASIDTQPPASNGAAGASQPGAPSI